MRASSHHYAERPLVESEHKWKVKPNVLNYKIAIRRHQQENQVRAALVSRPRPSAPSAAARRPVHRANAEKSTFFLGHVDRRMLSLTVSVKVARRGRKKTKALEKEIALAL
jgi:hypothetical protein